MLCAPTLDGCMYLVQTRMSSAHSGCACGWLPPKQYARMTPMWWYGSLPERTLRESPPALVWLTPDGRPPVGSRSSRTVLSRRKGSSGEKSTRPCWCLASRAKSLEIFERLPISPR